MKSQKRIDRRELASAFEFSMDIARWRTTHPDWYTANEEGFVDVFAWSYARQIKRLVEFQEPLPETVQATLAVAND